MRLFDCRNYHDFCFFVVFSPILNTYNFGVDIFTGFCYDSVFLMLGMFFED